MPLRPRDQPAQDVQRAFRQADGLGRPRLQMLLIGSSSGVFTAQAVAVASAAEMPRAVISSRWFRE